MKAPSVQTGSGAAAIAPVKPAVTKRTKRPRTPERLPDTVKEVLLKPYTARCAELKSRRYVFIAVAAGVVLCGLYYYTRSERIFGELKKEAFRGFELTWKLCSPFGDACYQKYLHVGRIGLGSLAMLGSTWVITREPLDKVVAASEHANLLRELDKALSIGYCQLFKIYSCAAWCLTSKERRYLKAKRQIHDRYGELKQEFAAIKAEKDRSNEVRDLNRELRRFINAGRGYIDNAQGD